MTRRIFAIALATVFAPVLALAEPPVSTQLPAKGVYAPLGFDTNDNSQVVISGYLPNLCYKAARVDTKVEGNTIKVNLTALKNPASGPFCLQVIVPFVEVASLGVLPKGDYQVVVNGAAEPDARAQLKVGDPATSNVDDHIYANVDSVQRVEGTRKVLLRGYHPSDCFELDRIDFISNGKDAYSVLPVLKKTGEVCPRKLVPFEFEAEVPTELSTENILLHVRVMNGKSVNAVFTNKTE